MDALAGICESIASNSGRLRKVAILAGYLRTLTDYDLARAVRFLSGGAVADVPPDLNLFGEPIARALSIGAATLHQSAIAMTGVDPEIFRLCAREVGDLGETIGLLIRDRTRALPMTLAQAQELYTQLYRTRQTAEKIRLLKQCLATHQPLTVKYFVKVISGNLRIGLLSKMVEEAIAAATGASLADVRAANNRLGNLATVAVAARRGELEAIGAELFHPMEFMLAKPLETARLLERAADWIVEDKYDGIRSQIHFAEGRAVIYSRGMDEVTHAFPEIAAAFQNLPGSGVIDGEVLAWRDGRALAFTVLQQRLARKRVTPEMQAGIPAAFMAYDILFRNGRLLLDCLIEERRTELEQALHGAEFPLLVSQQYAACDVEQVDRLFEEARERGDEGLMLKKRGSVYESGKRSGAWYKLKRAYASLDVVITAAEQGQGKRATVLSDYTFAVRSGDTFLNVGKAYSGLTDSEIRELTRILRAGALDRFGRVVLVRPEVVLEVAFDGIQKSLRHKSGFALRFPRILRWRRDKSPENCDDLARVQQLYDSSLNLTAGRE